jgi:hypothetical protein
MKQHKWHKEIKAWADGAEIEKRIINIDGDWSEWYQNENLEWDDNTTEFRIKPQPKEPQYLYVWNVFGKIVLTQDKNGIVIDTWDPKVLPKYVGKIKLEVKDE